MIEDVEFTVMVDYSFHCWFVCHWIYMYM